jgi:hypothetical protein
MAIDPVQGRLSLIDAGSRSILRWQQTDGSLDSRQLVARCDSLREPASLQITEDGSLWIGDAMANRVFHFSTEGELIQVIV